MKNRSFVIALKHSKSLAIIGAKGLPPEFPGTSGVEFYVSQRLIPLYDAGIRVVCYVRPWATARHIHKHKNTALIHLFSIPTGRLDAISHSFFATVHACFSRVDTVWYQAAGPAMFSFLPRIFGKKVVVTLHTLEWKREKWKGAAGIILLLAEKIAVHSANELLVVSQELADYCRRVYGKKSVVDTPIAPYARHQKPRIILDKYGLSKDQYLLYLGRFVPEKRIEWLIRAFKKLPGANLRLVLAGGSHHMGAYEASLRALASEDRRIYFTGWVFGKEKEELLTNCRLFVLPSSLEGNPTVLYELPPDRIALASAQVVKSVRRGGVIAFSDADEHRFFRKLHNIVNDVKMNHQ